MNAPNEVKSYMLEMGRRARAAAEGAAAEFKVGDAQALAFPDETFDTVLSAFGAMFAPDQEKTAAELLDEDDG